MKQIKHKEKQYLLYKLPPTSKHTSAPTSLMLRKDTHLHHHQALVYHPNNRNLYFWDPESNVVVEIINNEANVVKKEKINNLISVFLSFRPDESRRYAVDQQILDIEIVAGRTLLNCVLLIDAFEKFKTNAKVVNSQGLSAPRAIVSNKLKDDMRTVAECTINIMEIIQKSYDKGERIISFSDKLSLAGYVNTAVSCCKTIDDKEYTPKIFTKMDCKLAILFGILLADVLKDIALSQKLFELNDPHSNLSKDWSSNLNYISYMIGIKFKKLLNFDGLSNTTKDRVSHYLASCTTEEAEEISNFIREKDPAGEFICLEAPKVIEPELPIESPSAATEEVSARVQTKEEDQRYLMDLEQLTLKYFENPRDKSLADAVYTKIKEVLNESSNFELKLFASAKPVVNKELFELMLEYKKDFDKIVEKYLKESNTALSL